MTIYFVSTTGNDITGTGSQTFPFRTISKGISEMSSVDNLMIRGGLYLEPLSNEAGTNIPPGGGSWSTVTTIMAYNGEFVEVRPPGGFERVLNLIGSGRSYISIQDLKLNGVNCTSDVIKISRTGPTNDPPTSAHHIRIINCEVTHVNPGASGGWGNGILVAESNAAFVEIINCDIHDNGNPPSNQGHGIYFKGKDGLIDGCRLHNNITYGIQIYDDGSITGRDTSRTVLRNCKIYNNDVGSAQSRMVYVGMGTNHKVYNNLIYKPTQPTSGGVKILSSGCVFYNNTIYSCPNSVGELEIAGSNCNVRNNIIRRSSTQAGVLINSGSNNILTNNMISVNPLFLDENNNDFRLSDGSPAIGAGVNLFTVFNTDIDGNARSASGAWDIGAYVGGNATPPPPDIVPPVISIQNPISGSTVSGSIALTINVSD